MLQAQAIQLRPSMQVPRGCGDVVKDQLAILEAQGRGAVASAKDRLGLLLGPWNGFSRFMVGVQTAVPTAKVSVAPSEPLGKGNARGSLAFGDCKEWWPLLGHLIIICDEASWRTIVSVL